MSVASERVTDGRCVLKEVVNIPKATGDSSARLSRSLTPHAWSIVSIGQGCHIHPVITVPDWRGPFICWGLMSIGVSGIFCLLLSRDVTIDMSVYDRNETRNGPFVRDPKDRK